MLRATRTDRRGATPMIVDTAVLHSATHSTLPLGRRVSIGRHQFRAIASFSQRVAHAMAGWARTPILPTAALWEASVIARLIAEPDFHQPHGDVAGWPLHTDS